MLSDLTVVAVLAGVALGPLLAWFSHCAGEARWAGVALRPGRADRSTNTRGSLETWLALLALGSGRPFASLKDGRRSTLMSVLITKPCV